MASIVVVHTPLTLISSGSLMHYHVGVDHNYMDIKAAQIPNLHKNFVTLKNTDGTVNTDQLQGIIGYIRNLPEALP